MAELPTLHCAIEVDTTQLDDALAKIEKLANYLNPEDRASITATVAASIAASMQVRKPVSRRALFGLNWFKR